MSKKNLHELWPRNPEEIHNLRELMKNIMSTTVYGEGISVNHREIKPVPDLDRLVELFLHDINNNPEASFCVVEGQVVKKFRSDNGNCDFVYSTRFNLDTGLATLEDKAFVWLKSNESLAIIQFIEKYYKMNGELPPSRDNT